MRDVGRLTFVGCICGGSIPKLVNFFEIVCAYGELVSIYCRFGLQFLRVLEVIALAVLIELIQLFA